MASASLPDFLPPSTGGPTEQMKAYVKLLVQTAQTGVVTDFYNYLQHNPVNEHFDIKARVLEFTTTLETDTRQREQTNNFLFAQYDAKGYGRTGRWIQCAYCKIWYPRHMTLPMIPAADIDNWKTLHHNLCFSCARSSLDNQLLHPGQWLNVQEPPDLQVGEHTQLQAGSPDLTQTADRPAVLRTLDQENNPEHWAPHHWTLALPTTADVTYDAFILHYWSTTQLRWFRTPLANPKSDQYENPQPLTLSQFLSMATKVWKKREYYSRQEFTSRPRLAVYKDVLQQAKEQNPTASNSHLRRITANQLAFISNWSTHSVYHMDPKHRDQLLTALTKWHETHAEQALTGESPLKAYIQSPDFTEHLKEWWDAITPSLYNHFLCRNPTCKSVILNSHWLRTMDNNSPKQGVYLCPKCLETYRPFSGISHNKNIGELVPAKQCLVIKVPAQHSANAPVVGGTNSWHQPDTEHTYHCFLMQWPETDTQYLLNTMKQITADLLEGWIQADDKVLFLHSKLMAHLQKNTTTTIHETGSMDTEQHSRDPKQKHTSRIRQVQTWLASQDLECQDGLPWVLLWLFHLCVYGRDSNSRTPWSHRFDVFDVHSNLSLRNDQTAQPNHQETQSSLNIWADIFSLTPQHHLVCDGVYFSTTNITTSRSH